MQKFRKWLFKLSAYRIGVITGLLFTLATVLHPGRADQIPVIGRVESILHDWKFQLRGEIQPAGDVIVAAVDERALAVIGRWPFPRGVMGTLVDKLTAAGAKAIVFDAVYHDRVNGDQTVEKLRENFTKVALTSDQATQSLAELKAAVPSGPATESLKVLEKFRELQAGYATQLASASEGKSGDEIFAEAVHRSGHVVLGSILLRQSELSGTSPDEAKHAISLISHMRVPYPTLDPITSADEELINEGRPFYHVPWHTFFSAVSPYDELVKLPGQKEPPTMVAFFNTVPDPDGVIRREPLIMAVGDPRDPEHLLLVPNIDLGGVLKYWDADPGQTRLWSTSDSDNGLEYVAVLPGSAKGVNGPPKKSQFIRIPVDSTGELLLNYYGPYRTFPTVSLGDVWKDSLKRGQLDGKVVVVGATAQGTFDQRVTPFDQMVPGVITHATAIENMIHAQYLVRPWWAALVEALILIMIALLVGRLLAAMPVVWGFPVMLLTAVAYHLFDYLLFRAGISVFSAMPILEVSSIYGFQTIYRYSTEEREKRHIRRAFQFYLNKSVIEEMLRDPSKLKLGGDKKVLSVMFSDIRGFTTISEKLPAEALAKLINEYLTPMTNLVFEHGGTLDKYIGDAVMAIWGAPVEQPDHALRACKTAVAMMQELKRLQERWRAEGYNYPPIDIGIGINSGPMVVGNMGADQRFDYTVLGDNVNLASRLEGTNKDYRSHIIISQNTYEMVKDQVAALELGAVRVKGKKEPVRIYELLDDKPATGQMAEVIALFNEAMALFKQQKWAECRQQCNAVLEKWPNYGPPKAYIEFANDYESEPPEADWDGVYTMTHK